jgi:hypothetical protein
MAWGYTTNAAGGDGKYVYTYSVTGGRVDGNGNSRF